MFIRAVSAGVAIAPVPATAEKAAPDPFKRVEYPMVIDGVSYTLSGWEYDPPNLPKHEASVGWGD
jgi:hypothetical protein